MCNELLKIAIDMIENEGFACIVIKDGIIVEKKRGRGINPVIELYEGQVLDDAFVVDKVIGKASAAILSLANISEVYSIVMSKDAKKWFDTAKIPYGYKTESETILNRTLTGICPMEMVVKDLSNPIEMYLAIKEKIKELSICESY